MDNNFDQSLLEIAEIYQFQEDTIEQADKNVCNVYKKGRAAFLEGLNTIDKSDFEFPPNIKIEHFKLVRCYMLSSSFLSAMSHIKGNKKNRDKLAHSCTSLISYLGFDADVTFKEYLNRERLWRRILKSEGVSSNINLSKTAIIILLILCGIVLYVYKF